MQSLIPYHIAESDPETKTNVQKQKGVSWDENVYIPVHQKLKKYCHH